jgi:hypothetical protein
MGDSSRALVNAEESLDFSRITCKDPRHHFFAEPEQYRVKVQRFTHIPCEVTIQRISFDRDIERYCRAADLGLSSCIPRRSFRDPDRLPTAESLERSRRRAKIAVRLRVTELAPAALVTFTTRAVMPLDDLGKVWASFVRLVHQVDPLWSYVCVPEPHPSNLAHFHLHAAVRGQVNHRVLRRLWHMSLEAAEGRRVTQAMRGVDSPGNVDVQRVKASQVVPRVRKIGRYISKYITKGMVERFNRKAYWPAKGINLEAAQVFWLNATSQVNAIREAMDLLGHWDHVAPAFKLFQPSERVAWYAVDEGALPPPPF